MKNEGEFIIKAAIVSTLLSREERLAQLAEECNELGHAALKLRRVLDGTNPTPVTLKDAEENLIEEIADVMGCVALCTNNELGQWDKRMMEIFGNKMERWVERLTARGD